MSKTFDIKFFDNNIYDLSDWIGLKQIYGKFQQSSSPESETRVGSKPFKNLGPSQLKSKSNFLPKSDQRTQKHFCVIWPWQWKSETQQRFDRKNILKLRIEYLVKHCCLWSLWRFKVLVPSEMPTLLRSWDLLFKEHLPNFLFKLLLKSLFPTKLLNGICKSHLV